MNNKRMFNKKITETDLFLDMSSGSQMLYFHLNMNADDHGFVASPRKVIRMIGCANDDYKVLLAKRFIYEFESGVCLIKDWKIHNLLRQDRLTETLYKQELSTVLEDDNKSYFLDDGQVPGKCRLSIVKDSIVKDSIVKDSIVKDSIEYDFSFEDFYATYPARTMSKNLRSNFADAQAKDTFPKTIEELKLSLIDRIVKHHFKSKYKLGITTWLNNEKWLDDLDVESLADGIANEKTSNPFEKMSIKQEVMNFISELS